MDIVFTEEQQHLTQTYGKLLVMQEAIERRIETALSAIREYKNSMGEEIAPDFDSDDFSMEGYANVAALNSVIENFNIANEVETQNLERVHMLLKKPYFARIRLKFPNRPDPQDVYLGSSAAWDEDHKLIVVDWRSPVAEAYYNQDNGATSYWANGRLVHADLQLRRQFDIDHDRLRAYFDTTVAIEDPLLIAALTQRRSAQLQAITATIQKEQNRVIRHEDTPALLVKGIAGSGKTSVLLQRIAYLMYRDREHLSADQVYLITPNPVFQHYIRNVLPELGEKNPHTMTWQDLMALIGPGDRSLGESTPLETLERIEKGVRSLRVELGDLREISAGEHRLISIEQILKVIESYPRVKMGPKLYSVVEEDLLDMLDRRIANLGRSSAAREEVLCLSDDDQERLFGRSIDLTDDEDVAECARIYIEDLCEPCYAFVENAEWLRLDRMGMRLLKQSSLSGMEWLYLRIMVTGKVDNSARLVAVDEVQDYTASQLVVLARYFENAHFLMLGDENQAIEKDTATFADVSRVFERIRGRVDECELMTSYRSSPEITEFFTKLMEEDERVRTTSVRRPGSPARVLSFADEADYLAELVSIVREGRAGGSAGAAEDAEGAEGAADAGAMECAEGAEGAGAAVDAEGAEGAAENAAGAGEAPAAPGLTAIVARTRYGAKKLDVQLRDAMGEEAPVLLKSDAYLPRSGVVLLDLKLAKGLEFDHVVIPDATAQEYPEGTLSRHCLYTAASRATQRLTVLANGQLTGLLG